MEFARNMNLARYVASSGSGLKDLILVGKGQQMTSRIVAGAFEAFIAALYLDAGLAKTREVIFRFFPPKTTRFGAAKNYKKEPPGADSEGRTAATHLRTREQGGGGSPAAVRLCGAHQRTGGRSGDREEQGRGYPGSCPAGAGGDPAERIARLKDILKNAGRAFTTGLSRCFGRYWLLLTDQT